MKYIDNFLNSITMYRLLEVGLAFMVAMSIMLGFLGILPFSGWQYGASVAILVITCIVSNWIFAKIFRAQTNKESDIITALILFFVLMPPMDFNDAMIIAMAATIAMASKYIFAINKKHIFNPVAIATLILSLAGIGLSIWWIGSDTLLFITLIVGLLIVRKIHRFDLFFAFLLTSLITLIFYGWKAEIDPLTTLIQSFTSWPVLFFGMFMLTEPLTTPPTRKLRIAYGVITGFLFAAQFHIGPFYPSPQLALVVGNIFSYIVSPKQKLFLRLKERKALSQHVYDFIFTSNKPFSFQPGQYLEWTLAHPHADSRGVRRYFTIASSPTEPEIHLGVRLTENGSSFKKALTAMKIGDSMSASQLTGDFTLPENKKEKLVFIAGGIGVTPFRSMVQYMMDKKEKRDTVFFYCCVGAEHFAYKEIFDRAEKELNMRMVYVISDQSQVTQPWSGKVGRIDKKMVTEEVPDLLERTYYLSGPQGMVQTYKELLRSLGVPSNQIKTDYFPGF